jgi:hypothetical protein
VKGALGPVGLIWVALGSTMFPYCSQPAKRFGVCQSGDGNENRHLHPRQHHRPELRNAASGTA